MKTKAAVFYQPNQPLVIEELELEGPKTGEVLVKMAAVGLCRSDHNVMAGTRPVGMTPMVLGHEGAGVIEAVGPGVSRIKPGDHVVLMFIPSCGKCQNCVSGRSHACVLSVNIAKGPQLDGTYRLRNQKGQNVGQFCLLGAFSQYAVVNQDSVCVIDKSYPLNPACLVGCGVVGGYGAAVNRAGVSPGSSALVIGVGGVGMNAVQGAGAAGATTIIAADVVAQKLNWAKTFGATHTVNAAEADVVAEVMRLTGGAGVDFSFVGMANADTIGQAYAATGKLGTVVIIGLAPSDMESLPINPLNMVLMQKAVMGTLYGTSNAPAEIPKLLRMYRQRRLKLDELVTKTYTLDEINQGYTDMVAGKNLRGVVLFD
ncbi:MAG: Zn-dependent alcohol dehydrogenase [Anaerolineae bacterium]